MNDFIRKTKLYSAVTGMLCLLVSGLSSCIQEYPELPTDSNQKATEFSIQVTGMSNKVLTRAGETSTRTDLSRIEQVQVFLAKDGGIIKSFFRNGSSTEALVEETDYGTTGFVSVPTAWPVQPTDGTTTNIKFRVGSTDMGQLGVTHIYVVANYMNVNGDLAQVPSEVKTVEALRNLEQYGSAQDITKCVLFGELDTKKDGPVSTTSDQRSFKIPLIRTVAMVTLAVDGSELSDGIIITPKNVKLVNVPTSCKIGVENRVIYTSGITAETFNVPGLDKAWGGTCNAQMCTPLVGKIKVPSEFDPHGADEQVQPLYLFENRQGEKSISTPAEPGRDQTGKTVPPIAGCGSYIEVLADYYYTSKVDGGNPPQIDQSFLTGTITYRFYLGNNITNDFNVDRNKHYQLTLLLKNWGGLLEDGRIKDNVYVSGDTGDVSWRVDTDLNTGGGEGGDPHTIDIPANGSRLDIKLVGDRYTEIYNSKNNVKIELPSGANNILWVQNRELQNEGNNGWYRNPSIIDLSPHMWPNTDGSYTLRIYVKPYGQKEMDGLIETKNLHDLESWKNNGYRDLSFRFKEGNKTIDSYKIYQWLPMPVMQLENGTSIADPSQADLYFSRFDIYDGELLQWCPVAMHDEDLSDEGQTLLTGTDTLRIKSYSPVEPPVDGVVAGGPYVPYNYTIGFHTTTAFFVTDKKNDFANIQFNNGHPNTMIEFAFFAAANSELPEDSKNLFYQNAEKVTLLSHYGLATRTAWTRIEKAGVEDPRWPLIPGKAYWTSTIAQEPGDGDTSGTKSMVYVFGRGREGAKPMDRSMKFPGRLVYRKTDYSFPNVGAVGVRR